MTMEKKDKIKRLQEVLNEYKQYLRNYSKIKVELKKTTTRLLCDKVGSDSYGNDIFKSQTIEVPEYEVLKITYYGRKKNKAYHAYDVEVPIEDLELTIKKYKEKVNYWKNKDIK
jgi:hypothetical protein